MEVKLARGSQAHMRLWLRRSCYKLDNHSPLDCQRPGAGDGQAETGPSFLTRSHDVGPRWPWLRACPEGRSTWKDLWEGQRPCEGMKVNCSGSVL